MRASSETAAKTDEIRTEDIGDPSRMLVIAAVSMK
jgi:hypothetical protein